MKYRIICEIPRFRTSERFELETKEEFDDTVADIVNTINEDIVNCGLIEETATYNSIYASPGDLIENLLRDVKEIFNSIENKNVYGERLDTEGKVLEKIEIYDINDWIEGVQTAEQSTIYAIQAALNGIRKFVEQGYWQAGLIDENGIIHRQINKWCYEQSKESEISWSTDNKKAQPIVWFGLKDEANEDCWTIKGSKHGGKADESLYNHLALRWESWDLNWEILMGYSGDYIYNWIAEAGIDDQYVTDKVFEIFKNCPIELIKENDTFSIKKKINNYFITLISNK